MYYARRSLIVFFIFLLIFTCDKTTTGSDPITITFPDANFESLIREAINKPTGEILNTDLLTITKIDGEDRDISSIEGIEYCTNLDILLLCSNDITDISLLSGLTKINELDFSFNDIIDIQVLVNLNNLDILGLAGNEIVDISSLSGLAKLSSVFISINLITDISSLVNNSRIDNGDYVSLVQNPLSDTSINTYISQLEARGVTVNR